MLHPDCGKLAARVAVNALHKKTRASFMEVVEMLHSYKGHNGENASLIADDVYQIVLKHKERLDSSIDYKRDLDYDYFGYKTLERAYLLKVHGKIAERPQHMIMIRIRVRPLPLPFGPRSSAAQDVVAFPIVSTQ